MRPIITVASCAALAVSLLALSPQARADNDFLGQAQRFLNNGNNNDRDAYERGRDDEMRRQQAERDRWHHNRDLNRDERYGDQRYDADRYQNPNYRDYR